MFMLINIFQRLYKRSVGRGRAFDMPATKFVDPADGRTKYRTKRVWEEDAYLRKLQIAKDNGLYVPDAQW